MQSRTHTHTPTAATIGTMGPHLKMKQPVASRVSSWTSETKSHNKKFQPHSVCDLNPLGVLSQAFMSIMIDLMKRRHSLCTSANLRYCAEICRSNNLRLPVTFSTYLPFQSEPGQTPADRANGSSVDLQSYLCLLGFLGTSSQEASASVPLR